MGLINKIFEIIYDLAKLQKKEIHSNLLLKYNLPEGIGQKVKLLNPENILVGKNTYMNSGQIRAGEKTKIEIGDWCAIGYNVYIVGRTHDVRRPTGPKRVLGDGIVEDNIFIGDNVWIGNNVFIKQGVKIGNNVIIGANSVVTKNFGNNIIIAGNSAKIIKSRDKLD